MPSSCASTPGERLCTSFETQWPCHEIYCLGENDTIPPNFGLPAGGVINNINFEINGAYHITQNIVFNNCNFKMRPGASIVITPAVTYSSVTFNNCKFFSCNSMWRGITINASNTSHLAFSFIGCWVEDAYIGLSLDEGKPYYYSVYNSKFINNHIGISNRKQNATGSAALLNAVLTGNNFTSTGNLAPIPLSMQSLPMPFHPFAYAGVKYVQTSTAIGPSSPNPGTGTVNNFSCMVYGIVTQNATITSGNNDFANLDAGFGAGIYATDGSVRVLYCHFENAGIRCIHTLGADLTAKGNHFEGSSQIGILAENNLNAEFITIDDVNVFDISDAVWNSGIEIQRSTASSGVHNIIKDNTFNVSGDASGLSCIRALGFYGSATDEMHIDNNHVNVFSNSGAVDGISVYFGNSEGTKVRGNVLNYASTNPYSSFGFNFNGGGMTTNNEVRNNTVTGASNASMSCSFHSIDLEGTEFCENTVDHSTRGLHFKSQNDVVLRENHINHHDFGIWIEGSDARIGQQHGRGNMWSTNPNDCIVAAAKVSTNTGTTPDPFNSEFQVPESNLLPYLPPSNKIDPNPTLSLQQWFWYNNNTNLDYCMGIYGGGPVKVTPYQGEAVLNISTLTGVPLWDLKRKTYAKLLLNPGLRPGGSTEETWFNSLNGSTIAYFGQVEQMMFNSMSLSTTGQQAFDTYRQAIFHLWTDLDAVDALVDFSNAANLTDTYFSDRAELLEGITQNAEYASALENSRNQQTNQSLQNALTFNTNITSSQAYETSRKTLNDILIRHLLCEPMTLTWYEEILSLAQQDTETAGSATNEVVPYLAACDRHQFKDTDESGERSNETRGMVIGISEMLRIAPNPTNGLAEVSVSKGFVGLLTLLDASGKKIRSISIEKEENIFDLDMSHQIPGLYWIALSDTSGRIVASAKFSVTH